MPSLVSAALLAGAVAFSLVAGCVDPQSDYNDWLGRTVDARAGGPVIEAGPFEAAPPDGGFTQTYAMACSTQISPGLADSTRFFATATYTPDATGGGGQFTFQDQPLVAHATTVSDFAGDPAAKATVPVSSDGKASIDFGPTTVPGAANPINGGDIKFDATATLNFIIGQDTLCAGLTGNITDPLPITLDPTKGDVCLFFPAAPGSDFPSPSDDEFTNSPCHAL